MTDFSFQNRAYDLILNIKEDRMIGPRIESVKELRLLADITKIASQDMVDQYRPVECQEILPGIRLKIVEPTYTWYQTFWTYQDTGEIIPPEKTTLRMYNQAYMYIWEKAQRGNVFIKNIFKYRIGDYVAYKPNQLFKGCISDKTMLIGVERYKKYTNAYKVEWETPFEGIYWFNEKELIKLEASPMKTEKPKIIKYTKKYNPTKWLDEQVRTGKDRAVMLTLLQRYNMNKDFGWVQEEIKRPRKHSAKDRKAQRLRRKNRYIANLINVQPIQEEALVCVKWKITDEVARVKKSYAKKLVEQNNGKYVYTSKTEWKKYLKGEKDKPKLCLPEGKDIMGHEYTLGNRRLRRSIGDRKQKNITFHKVIPKLSADDRLERSILDRERYLRKKGKKSLDDLKHEFQSDERRNDKFTVSEKWSTSLIKLYTAVTTSVAEVAKGIFVNLPKKGIKVIVNDIIKSQHKFSWSNDKIDDFLRYLRLTTHGVFTGPKTKVARPEGAKKLARVKKVKQIIEHEPIKFATRIDHTKLKLDENKQVVDTGGGITQIPIKFKRKRK